MSITVLTSELFVLISCAGSLTEEEKYERQEVYVQMVIDYDDNARRCRGFGVSLVSSAAWTRNISGKLSVGQMISARCVSRS